MGPVNRQAAGGRRIPPRPRVRADILEAAAAVFVERGFAGASIDLIAAAAGYTKGAVYSNFASKDELFFALMDAQVSARADLARQLVDQLPGDDDVIAEIGRRLTAVMVANRDWQLLFIEYWLRAMRDPAIQDRFVTYRRQVRSAIADQIEALIGGRRAADTPAASDLTLVVLALSNGLAVEELLDPGTVPPDLVGTLLAGYLEGTLGPGPGEGSTC